MRRFVLVVHIDIDCCKTKLTSQIFGFPLTMKVSYSSKIDRSFGYGIEHDHQSRNRPR